jgi:hypothetical protein
MSTSRSSGFCWIQNLEGQPDPARWDAEGEFWVLLGREGQADAGLTALGPVLGRR